MWCGEYRWICQMMSLSLLFFQPSAAVILVAEGWEPYSILSLFYFRSVASTFIGCRVLIFSIRGKFDPLQFIVVHQGTGKCTVGHAVTFGDKLHTDSLYLLAEVEVHEFFHPLRVEHVTEVAEVATFSWSNIIS